MENSNELFLQNANITIHKQSLSQPLIVIANYFFDTIPQELFWVENQTISQCLLSLATAANPAESNTAELIKSLELQYDYQTVQPPIYPHQPSLNNLLETYTQQLQHTHLFFPHIGILCLERLRLLSQQGLVLLSADKGEHSLWDLENCPAPTLATHGRFSLTVNYHAFCHYCNHQGGLALFPRHQQAILDLVCLLFLTDANTYSETINTYDRFVGDYGPDDYFSLKKLIEQHFATLTYRDIMAVIRLSGYNGRIFRQMLPRLLEILPTITYNQRWNLFLAIPRIWDTYYPLGESEDLAEDLGDLLITLAFYQEAILYFEKSVMIYGKTAHILYKIAICHYLLGEFSTASLIIKELLADDPDNVDLQELMQQCDSSIFPHIT